MGLGVAERQGCQLRACRRWACGTHLSSRRAFKAGGELSSTRSASVLLVSCVGGLAAPGLLLSKVSSPLGWGELIMQVPPQGAAGSGRLPACWALLVQTACPSASARVRLLDNPTLHLPDAEKLLG